MPKIWMTSLAKLAGFFYARKQGDSMTTVQGFIETLKMLKPSERIEIKDGATYKRTKNGELYVRLGGNLKTYQGIPIFEGWEWWMVEKGFL